MEPATYFETVVITILTVIAFITLVLAFMYMIFVKEETPTAKA